MTKRDNHYEAAFEAYLRARAVPYVAVDETRRSPIDDDRAVAPIGGGNPAGQNFEADAGRIPVSTARRTLKSVDFIVSGSTGGSWLVDVKGRRFPSGRAGQLWKNWSTWDDLTSLARWEETFGDRFRALFVFAYNVIGDRAPLPAEQLFTFRQRVYGFVAIPLHDYAAHARRLSVRWDTVTMPVRQFRALAAPLEDWL